MTVVQTMNMWDTVNNLVEDTTGLLLRKSADAIVLAVTVESLTPTEFCHDEYLRS